MTARSRHPRPSQPPTCSASPPFAAPRKPPREYPAFVSEFVQEAPRKCVGHGESSVRKLPCVSHACGVQAANPFAAHISVTVIDTGTPIVPLATRVCNA